MSRWSVPIILITGWLVLGLVGILTREPIWFTLSGVTLIAALVTLLVACVQTVRARAADRREQLELLREIAEQGRNA